MGLRICTIGCGNMAHRYHGPSYALYAAICPDTELVACCDIDAEKAERFRDRFGFDKYYTDIERMLDRERPDAVCLVVPESLTCELACRVLQKGYPLLMEKPPGLVVEETDRMITAADNSGAPTQVAVNRRYMPLVRKLEHMLRGKPPPKQLQHIQYDFVRVNRTDADFATTAIHGIDTVRFLAGSDYAHVRFHYQEFPALGPTTANILMDCLMTSGATAHLSFCPVAGVVIERAIVHTYGHTFFLNVPVWDALDTPGRLQHLDKGVLALDVDGTQISDGPEGFQLMGFYGENASFFEDIRNGRRPAGDLRAIRQSVEIAQCTRERRREYGSPD